MTKTLVILTGDSSAPCAHTEGDQPVEVDGYVIGHEPVVLPPDVREALSDDVDDRTSQ